MINSELVVQRVPLFVESILTGICNFVVVGVAIRYECQTRDDRKDLDDFYHKPTTEKTVGDSLNSVFITLSKTYFELLYARKQYQR